MTIASYCIHYASIYTLGVTPVILGLITTHPEFNENYLPLLCVTTSTVHCVSVEMYMYPYMLGVAPTNYYIHKAWEQG